jgi:hypothetical protein
MLPEQHAAQMAVVVPMAPAMVLVLVVLDQDHLLVA